MKHLSRPGQGWYRLERSKPLLPPRTSNGRRLPSNLGRGPRAPSALPAIPRRSLAVSKAAKRGRLALLPAYPALAPNRRHDWSSRPFRRCLGGEKRSRRFCSQPLPVALSLTQTIPTPEPDDGLGKLIGQMLIVGFQGVAPDESWPRQVAAQIESGKIGGVLVMSHNLLAPDQLVKLNNAFRRTKAPVAPFIAVDQGGGLAQRLPAEKGFQQYASAAELGMSNDPLNAYNLYQRMAMELFVHGFNVNLGPVVDLEQTSENGAAAAHPGRYGSRPKHVAAFAKAFRLAHHGEGLLTVLKHFPGPPSVDTDTSGTEAAAHWTAASLEPYRQLVAGGNADMVMVGHLAHAEFSDEPGLPASLSKRAIQTRLRDEIGFKGVIISDDLEAKAVTTRFSLEESVVRAIAAGNDLLLIGNQDNPSPDLPDKVAAIVRHAVKTGVLTRERLQASYDRIIAAKQSLSQAAREIASAKHTDADEEKPAAP